MAKKNDALMIAALLGVVSMISTAAPSAVTFAPSAPSVEAYDFLEVVINVTAPDASNPFTGVTVSGSFSETLGTKQWHVDGFCDSLDGSLYRIRFVPPAAGGYRYSVTFRQGAFEKNFTGIFQAAASHRNGPIRVDPQILGISFGKGPESTISSVAQLPTGSRDGKTSVSSTAALTVCIASK